MAWSRRYTRTSEPRPYDTVTFCSLCKVICPAVVTVEGDRDKADVCWPRGRPVGRARHPRTVAAEVEALAEQLTDAVTKLTNSAAWLEML